MPSAELFPIVAEAAKTGKPLREAVGTTLADVWQGLWGDKLAAWRLKNAATLNEALGNELAERGLALNLDKIPERFAYAWFDKATQEDEPEIQALFAKLLANAAEGNEDALNRRNVAILAQFTPNDAKLLDIIGQGYLQNIAAELKVAYEFDVSDMIWELKRDHAFEDSTAIDTLIAARILEPFSHISLSDGVTRHLITSASRQDIRPYSGFGDAIQQREMLRLTATGEGLIRGLYK